MNPSNLIHQVRLIAHFHPWYEKLLSESGISLPGLSPDDGSLLGRLPLMTAELLEENYYSQPPREEAGLSVYRTSGTSTGTRKAIYYSSEDDRHYMEAKRNSWMAWLGESHGIKRALADLGTGHAASSALALFESVGAQGEAIAFTAPIGEHIAKLREFQPQLLYTMPSILEALVDAVTDPKTYNLRKIILVGELASAEWQANMAMRLGLSPRDLLDTYGSIEVGAIAAYSHELGCYLLANSLYGEVLPAERIGEQYMPLMEDEGVLALTSFSRSLFPAIRFITYDVVRDFRTVQHNGMTFQAFRCITKRIGPELKHGEKISLYDMEEAVSRHLADASLRVKVQDNRLKLYIKSEHTNQEKLLAVKHDIEHKIDDIGVMIRNRLLQGIEIIPVETWEQLPKGSVKAKKLYQ